MNKVESAFDGFCKSCQGFDKKQLSSLMHQIDTFARFDHASITENARPSSLPAQFATLRGKFIDENDWWWDGKVPGASINAYLADDNSHLGGTSTDQNGLYTLTGPFFGKQVRLVADPPPGARCPNGAQTVVLVVDSVIKTHDFKDECKF